MECPRVADLKTNPQRGEILRNRAPRRVASTDSRWFLADRPRSRAGTRIVVGVATLLVVAAGSWPLAADAPPASEFEVKSAFLPRFLQFAEWTPPKAGGNGDAGGVRIAVLGDSPFCSYLPTALAKLPPAEARVTVFRASHPDKSADADIVFVCESERSRLGSLVRTLEEFRVLTVGETSGFGAAGVMLNLYVGSDQRVRFEANTNAATRAGIRMSSHLLRMARIVG
jgi:hypothetical protein